jgi:hypothetical protein
MATPKIPDQLPGGTIDAKHHEESLLQISPGATCGDPIGT